MGQGSGARSFRGGGSGKTRCSRAMDATAKAVMDPVSGSKGIMVRRCNARIGLTIRHET